MTTIVPTMRGLMLGRFRFSLRTSVAIVLLVAAIGAMCRVIGGANSFAQSSLRVPCSWRGSEEWRRDSLQR